ncbi:Crp/Fnr family transcriptional regulator [Streptomyces sp. NBC_00053]|uniref:Crp/Fnr family transcriptional regulator n=1 Tax=unclassified Streptomyces TaxID=2593676 RepID=UPI000F5BFD36|nr:MULTISPECIES: Crp/Fnr family transcriptional regulator [unclassified Streptomyces]WSX03379.1 Crp/Fnr family transcriptional regulator [Streptomyces sp. NBC_00987]MCX4394639.1 Crp/Fnr family transcriptional regulator [Streptomyces sp. NBC_01767]MCX5502514.1 Crp/Fnr family transcriptional regulator [Streptomyces sp. NBC_00052]MCX5548950.1 Crp/Fnr family transcriptional regulator [Streptomyces sp. NBC_00051]RPK75639.1 cAMP receptor protein [Streptomyces sp. ADI95-17]
MAAYVADGDGLDDRVPFLARLEREDRVSLLGLGRELSFASRAPLLRQDEPSSYILLIINGWTKVTTSAPNGYEALHALRGPGDIVGESASLTGRPRSATVTALSPVRAVVVPHEKFRAFVTGSAEISLTLLALTADRTRAADRRSLEFAAMTVRERFAVLLLDLAHTHGVRTDEGIELDIPLSKQELAGAVGASREMVQRLLKDLRARGIVLTGRRAMVIVRPDSLRRIARAQDSVRPPVGHEAPQTPQNGPRTLR